jgi:branched-chain amino acid transport system ATP-binding protein
MAETRRSGIRGYGLGSVATPLSVDEVAEAVGRMAAGGPDAAALAALVEGEPHLKVAGLVAGYGEMQILHGIDLFLGRGQSLCLIGPNGAGKSTVLHAIYGLARVMSGTIEIGGHDVARLDPNRKLSQARIAYILQDSSIFPDMTVEENLRMGGYLMPKSADARRAAEQVFDRYPALADRRRQLARVLSGGERRLLEISRALAMGPEILLVDEPSIGLEPRFIDMVFEILGELQQRDRKTIVMVEQNARKGLEFADLGYVLAAGQVVMAGKGRELLENPEVGRLFLGG